MTEKQKLFCEEYLIDLNATQAALRAGYSEKTAYSIGNENLKKPEIQEYIQKRLKEKEDAEKFEKIKAWTKVAVEAAEMIYNGAGRGAEKKAYVLEYLNSKGYKLDSDTIDKLIESAVLELKKS